MEYLVLTSLIAEFLYLFNVSKKNKTTKSFTSDDLQKSF